MDGGFEVVGEHLRASGAAMERAAAQAGDLRVERHVSAVGAAMPSSATAAAAGELAAAWASEFGQWVRATARHGEALRADARDYDAVDAAVGTALTRTTPVMR